MIAANFLVLVLICTAASAQDEKEYELAELSKEIKKELSQEQEIQAEELEGDQSDRLDEEPEVRSYVVHLNSTERHKLEEALQAMTIQREMLETELAEKNCQSEEIEIEQEPDTESLENSKSCSQLQKDYLKAKMAMNVFTAMKLVDDEVSKELPLNDEARQKRSLERRELLTSLDQELKEGAKRLGHDTRTPSLSRSKRATVAQLASQPCSASKSFKQRYYNAANKVGKTIQVQTQAEGGISVLGIGVGLSTSKPVEVYHTYGPKGEFGCAATACVSTSADSYKFGVSASIKAGFYYNFGDVDGESITTLYSASVGGLVSIGGSYGTIEKPDGRKIGHLTGASLSVGKSKSVTFFGVSSTSTKCDAVLTAPGCIKKLTSFQQKYNVKCRGWTWRRCVKYKTTYRYRYLCPQRT